MRMLALWHVRFGIAMSQTTPAGEDVSPSGQSTHWPGPAVSLNHPTLHAAHGPVVPSYPSMHVQFEAEMLSSGEEVPAGQATHSTPLLA
eukprot:1043853-Rhodomonas_salina.1